MVMMAGLKSTDRTQVEGIDVTNHAAHVAAMVNVGFTKAVDVAAFRHQYLDLLSLFGATGSGYRIDVDTQSNVRFADSNEYTLMNATAKAASVATNASVALPTALNFGTGNFSIEWWAGFDAQPTFIPAMLYLGDAGSSGARLIVDATTNTFSGGSRISLRYDDLTNPFGGTINLSLPASVDAFDGRVHHYVLSLTRNGASSKIELYFDGAKQTEYTWDDSANAAKTVNFSAVNGRVSICGGWNGVANGDQRQSTVRIYNAILYANEVLHRTRRGPNNLPTDGVSPVAYFDPADYTANTGTVYMKDSSGANIITLDYTSNNLNHASWPGGAPATDMDSFVVTGLSEATKQFSTTKQFLSILPYTDGLLRVTRLG